jgi:hypothetical protein
MLHSRLVPDDGAWRKTPANHGLEALLGFQGGGACGGATRSCGPERGDRDPSLLVLCLSPPGRGPGEARSRMIHRVRLILSESWP